MQRLSNSMQPWLLILDNCDDTDQDYAEYFLQGSHGAVIMTSRPDYGDDYGSTGSSHLEGLDAENAIAVLLKAAKAREPYTDSTKAVAKRIANELGYHPLALIVAGSLIKSGLYSLEEYSQVLSKQQEQLFIAKPKQAGSTYGSLHATFEVSLQRLQRSPDASSRHAVELFSILAFLDRTDVTEDMFTRAWKWGEENRGNELVCDLFATDTDWDIQRLSPWHFETALSVAWASATNLTAFRLARAHLFELALVSLDSQSKAVSMHPLLHSWARNRLQEAQQARIWGQTAATLCLSLEGAYTWQPFTYAIQRHLEACIDTRRKDVQFLCPDIGIGKIDFLFFWQLYRAGNHYAHKLALELELNIYPDWRVGQGKIDENQYEVLRVLGFAFTEKKDYQTAILASRRAFEAIRALLPLSHNTVQDAQKSLVHTLLAMENFQEAIDTLEPLMSWEKKMVHVGDAIDITFYLGRAYRGNGESERAIPLLEEALRLQKLSLTPGHPQLLAMACTLSDVLLIAKDHERAAEVLKEQVHAAGEILPAENINLITAQHFLGLAYRGAGRMDESVDMLTRVVTIRSKTSAPSEEGLLISRGALAHSLYGAGLSSLAVAQQELVVAEHEKTLPPSSHQRHKDEYALVLYHTAAGQLEDARLLMERMKEAVDMLDDEDRKDLEELEADLEDEEISQSALECNASSDLNGEDFDGRESQLEQGEVYQQSTVPDTSYSVYEIGSAL